ncbi:hypothetical protein GQ457_03G032300 [Hibiscus cannabinus]
MSSALNKKDLQRIFEKLDKSGDGFVSLEELLRRIGVEFSQQELESLVGKPRLDLDEFLSLYDSISNIIEEEGDLAKAFKVFDLNGDGLISCEELESVLGRLGLWDENSGQDCRRMIRFYDTNFDGFLDFEEFKSMLLRTVSS